MITGNMVFSILAGREVDCGSEEWRHECECKWMLANKPTRSTKHLWLYGTYDRKHVVSHTGKLRDDWKLMATEKSSILHKRGLAAADRMLADAKRIYEATAGK